jgi:hypothetical protein
LNYDTKDKLWQRFGFFELPNITDSSIVNLLAQSTKQAKLEANSEDFEAIALKSDHSYRTILLNLRRLSVQNKVLNKEDFIETLYGSWQDIFQRDVKQHPAIEYIFEAIDMRRQAGIDLYPAIIESTALLTWRGNIIQNVLRRRKIRRALHYLTYESNVLLLTNYEIKPRYGQIEAKKRQVNWQAHATSLQNILTKFSKNRQELSIYSLLKFGNVLYQADKIQNAILIWKRGLKITPENVAFWTNLGIAYATLPKDIRKGQHKGTLKRIVRSLSGISFPFFGLSWIPFTREVDNARKLLIFLEDQRLLLHNPEDYLIKLNDPLKYLQSTLNEMISGLRSRLEEADQFSPLAEIISAMRSACIECSQRLDTNKTVQQNMGAINNLRTIFGLWISIMCARYELVITENQLTAILPQIREQCDIINNFVVP